MSASPNRPQSPLDPVAIARAAEERQALLHDQYAQVGVCGRFTQFFLKNLALLLLLFVSLIALCAWFPAPLGLVMGEHCKMHHDQILGRLWLECPEALRQAFGPRR